MSTEEEYDFAANHIPGNLDQLVENHRRVCENYEFDWDLPDWIDDRLKDLQQLRALRGGIGRSDHSLVLDELTRRCVRNSYVGLGTILFVVILIWPAFQSSIVVSIGICFFGVAILAFVAICLTVNQYPWEELDKLFTEYPAERDLRIRLSRQDKFPRLNLTKLYPNEREREAAIQRVRRFKNIKLTNRDDLKSARDFHAMAGVVLFMSLIIVNSLKQANTEWLFCALLMIPVVLFHNLAFWASEARLWLTVVVVNTFQDVPGPTLTGVSIPCSQRSRSVADQCHRFINWAERNNVPPTYQTVMNRIREHTRAVVLAWPVLVVLWYVVNTMDGWAQSAWAGILYLLYFLFSRVAYVWGIEHQFEIYARPDLSHLQVIDADGQELRF